MAFVGALFGGLTAKAVATKVVTGLAISFVAQKLFPAPSLPQADVSQLKHIDREPIADPKQTLQAAVTGAKYIIGKARVGGLLIKVDDGDFTTPDGVGAYDFYMSFCLSEGNCDSIEDIYIDGVETDYFTPIRKGQTRNIGIPGFTVVPINVGSKTFDYLCQATYRNTSSYTIVDMHFVQPPYNNHFLPEAITEQLSRVWTTIPTVQFLVNGIKFSSTPYASEIRAPSESSGPTRNVAVWRYWYERHIIGRSKGDFAIGTVNASIGYCTTNRYVMDGYISADDPPDTVRAEMDWCWQGSAYDWRGDIYFRPGYERNPHVTTINMDEDAIEFVGGKPGPAIQDRYNSAKCSILQSAQDDYLSSDISKVSLNDGHSERLLDLGLRRYVTDEAKARTLMAIFLRRQRNDATFSYRILNKPDDGFRSMSIFPGFFYKLTDSNFGFDEVEVMCTGSTLNPDWSVTVALTLYQSGTYNQTSYSYREREPYSKIPRFNDRISSPDSFELSYKDIISTGLHSEITATWTVTAYRTLLIINGPDNFYEFVIATGNTYTFQVFNQGTYTVNARHRSIKNIDSNSVSESITIDWSTYKTAVVKGLDIVYGNFASDNSVVTKITVAWNNQVGILQTVVNLSSQLGGTQELIVGNNVSTCEFTVFYRDTYTATVYHINLDSSHSDSDSVNTTVDWEDKRPFAPQNIVPFSSSTILSDESVEYIIGADWDDDVNALRSEITITGPDFNLTVTGTDSSVRVVVPKIGEYDFDILLFGLSGLRSEIGETTSVVTNNALLVPDVSNPVFTSVSKVAADGSINTLGTVGWDYQNPQGVIAKYYTTVVIDGPNTNSEQTTRENSVSQLLPLQGLYTAKIKHSLAGFESAEAIITHNLDWSQFAPPAPTLIRIRVQAGNFQCIFESIPNRDIEGIEFRYRSGNSSGSEELPVIDEDNWDASPRMDVSSIVPSVGGENIIATVSIPSTARFRIFARYITRQGLRGNIADLGYSIFSLPVLETGALNDSYLWPGKHTNIGVYLSEKILVPDIAKTSLTRNLADGNSGWPFGIVTGTEYLTGETELSKSSNVQFRVDVEYFTPPNPAITPDNSGNFYVLASVARNGTASATPVAITINSWTQLPTPVQFLRFMWRGSNSFQGQGIRSISFNWELLS